LKKSCGKFFECSSTRRGGAIGNRKSAIPAILGQAMMLENQLPQMTSVSAGKAR
jgi:hypothetical protein